MINATDLRNGATFLSNDQPYKVIKYTHTKLGRGGATVRVTAKNLVTGATEDKTFSSNVKVEDVAMTKRKLQFLYHDNVNAVFMDPSSYEQLDIPLAVIKADLPFVKEGSEVNVLFWSERPLSIEIPPKVTLEVTDTPPGVKGDSASNIYKTAKLENGISIKVPLFVNIGDKVIIDTRTGEYVERAK